MNIINLLKSPELSVISVAAVFYVLTFSLAGVLAPFAAHAGENLQGTYQVAQEKQGDR